MMELLMGVLYLISLTWCWGPCRKHHGTLLLFDEQGSAWLVLPQRRWRGRCSSSWCLILFLILCQWRWTSCRCRLSKIFGWFLKEHLSISFLLRSIFHTARCNHALRCRYSATPAPWKLLDWWILLVLMQFDALEEGLEICVGGVLMLLLIVVLLWSKGGYHLLVHEIFALIDSLWHF